VWFELARRSALALLRLHAARLTLAHILTSASIENAMLVHAAFGGSTNLLLHIPAIAHAAGLPRPGVEDWIRVNRAAPRLVDVLPTDRTDMQLCVYMSGGVPEAMLHLRKLGLSTQVLIGEARHLAGYLGRQPARGRAPVLMVRYRSDRVIMSPGCQEDGSHQPLVFPVGNLAPQGSVVKATAIDPSVVGEDQVYRLRGRARVCTSEAGAIRLIKGLGQKPIQPGEILVYIGGGPLGTGMEETYQLTAALKHLPWGKHIPLLTDARFSGVSTAPCVGHRSGSAGGWSDWQSCASGDRIEIVIEGKSWKAGSTWWAPQKRAPLMKAGVCSSSARSSSSFSRDERRCAPRLWAALQEVGRHRWSRL
jgi:dihydroxyacid dehydratase/phosphogluconate dehydratase